MTLLLALLGRVPLRAYIYGALGLVLALLFVGLRHQVDAAHKERDAAIEYSHKLEAGIAAQNQAIELMKAKAQGLQDQVDQAQGHVKQIDKQTGLLLDQIKNQPVPNEPMQALGWLAQNHNRVASIFNKK